MTDKPHTPEPWFIGDTPGYLALGQWKDGKSRFSDPITIRSAAHTEEIATVWTYLLPTDANARRIVACVNASEGISTEALEATKDIAMGGLATVKSIEEQRDELADVLRELVERCDGPEGVRADGSNIQTMRASAALAKLGDKP